MSLALVTLLVPSYDEGIAFFVGGLGWQLLGDEDQGRKRWVTVAPVGTAGTALLLAEPTSDGQRTALGAQLGDRVGFFLHTDDFTRDAARIDAAGGRFLEAPRREAYGTVAQWRDPWGNLWDLLEPAE
ncbi:VOC family protein [Rhodobacterales bacterium HKCCE4037]|nr:VOC family protein [Rhodobacterales bacterium HKCCE4037]